MSFNFYFDLVYFRIYDAEVILGKILAEQRKGLCEAISGKAGKSGGQ